MNFLIILKVALRSLRRTMLRSGLTALGIIVGVAAVIAMVSIGNGASAKVKSALASVDTNLIRMQANIPRHMFNAQNGPANRQLMAREQLTLADYAAVRTEVPGVGLSSVLLNSSVNGVKANGRRATGMVTGMDVDGIAINRRQVLRGVAFGQSDVGQAASVCLISENLAGKLFAFADPVGARIQLGTTPFTVIGVLKDDTSLGFAGLGDMTGDSSIILPYTSLLRRLNPRAHVSILVKAEDPAQVGVVQQRINDLMEMRRGTRKAEFIAGNAADTVKAFMEGTKAMTLLLGAIGGISLLVGGIGIMNIMLVSVTERTREIGIRLAIGTRGRDVLRQFLIESTILSVLGGAIGILLGVGIAIVITTMNDWPTVITFSSVAGAFLCSAAVGVFFGYYPARQAARLDPIQALRSE
jgi:putative ABC transport system permease protein